MEKNENNDFHSMYVVFLCKKNHNSGKRPIIYDCT
jgi:hypothetical protein